MDVYPAPGLRKPFPEHNQIHITSDKNMTLSSYTMFAVLAI